MMSALTYDKFDVLTRNTLIRKEWKQNQVTEQDLVKTLSEKYGEGTLDPKTGSFIPVDKK